MLLTTSDCTPTRLCLSLGPPLGGKQGKVIFLRMDVPVFERMIQVASTRLEHLDVTCPRHTSEVGPKFAIVITNQVLWRLPIRGSFPELLRHPGIGRRSCDADMDHFP